MLKLKSSYMLTNAEGEIIMGEGRLLILESIQRTGSINQTAKELGMGYKTVWSKIKTTEAHLGKAVVKADRRKGTRLTDEGKRLIEKYRRLKDACIQADDRIFEAIFL